MPAIDLRDHLAEKPWRKIGLWRGDLDGVSDNVLFVDLDVVITGSIDDFFTFAPDETFCVIENWTQKGQRIGNTSVYRFRVGAHPELFERLMRDPAGVTAAFPNSQTHISRTILSMKFWPDSWCVSFKHTLLPAWPMNFLQTSPLPPTAKVVCFTGKPDPDEARDGLWPAPYKKPYKFVRPTPWIRDHWQ